MGAELILFNAVTVIRECISVPELELSTIHDEAHSLCMRGIRLGMDLSRLQATPQAAQHLLSPWAGPLSSTCPMSSLAMHTRLFPRNADQSGSIQGKTVEWIKLTLTSLGHKIE